jgi:hypothetical protein
MRAYATAVVEPFARNDGVTVVLAAVVAVVAAGGYRRASGAARRAGVPGLVAAWRSLLSSPSERSTGSPAGRPTGRCSGSTTRFEPWRSDMTHWALGDGSPVEIVNVIDDHSRLCVASVALAVTKATDVAEIFSAAPQRHGTPASVLINNGCTYTAAHRVGKVVMAQPGPAPPRHRAAHTGRGLCRQGQSSSRPARSPHPFPGPPRPRRQDRLRDTAPPEPADPHRHRPSAQGPTDPAPRRRPRRPSGQRKRRTDPPADHRPQPRLPGSRSGVMSTMSRDICLRCPATSRRAPDRTRTCGLPLRRLRATVQDVRHSPLTCTDSAVESVQCAPVRGGRRSLGPA